MSIDHVTRYRHLTTRTVVAVPSGVSATDAALLKEDAEAHRA